MANTLVTPHFHWTEIICRCCDRIRITPGLFSHMDTLEAMREQLGFPIIVNSGYRCPEHNKAVGGAPSSWHLLFATDVRPADGDPDKLHQMYKLALNLDWGGIGLYDTFIHLDRRPDKSRWREA